MNSYGQQGGPHADQTILGVIFMGFMQKLDSLNNKKKTQKSLSISGMISGMEDKIQQAPKHQSAFFADVISARSR